MSSRAARHRQARVHQSIFSNSIPREEHSHNEETIDLAEYKVPFMAPGLLSNAAGIGYLLINIRRGRRHLASNSLADASACHTPSGTGEVPG